MFRSLVVAVTIDESDGGIALTANLPRAVQANVTCWWLHSMSQTWALAARLSDWLTDRQFDWLTDRQTEWRTDSLTSWQADRSTNWLTDWQFDWLTDYLADWYLKALCYRLLSTCRAAGQERNKGWRRLDSNGGERGGDRPLPKLRMFVQTARYLDEECHRVRRQQVTHWARHALNITLLQ